MSPLEHTGNDGGLHGSSASRGSTHETGPTGVNTGSQVVVVVGGGVNELYPAVHLHRIAFVRKQNNSLL